MPNILTTSANVSSPLLVAGPSTPSAYSTALYAVYGNPDETNAPTIDYEDFVTQLRSRMIASYAKVRETLRRGAKRNKRHYDCKVKPARFAISQ